MANKFEHRWKISAFNKIICEASLVKIENLYKEDMKINDAEFVYETKAYKNRM